MEDAINLCMRYAYDNAIDENDLHPLTGPEIDIVQLESGKNFIFTAPGYVKPEVELGEYMVCLMRRMRLLSQMMMLKMS